MIIKENVIIDGCELIRNYSDTYLIRKVGTNEVYIDTLDTQIFEYEETADLLPLKFSPTDLENERL